MVEFEEHGKQTVEYELQFDGANTWKKVVLVYIHDYQERYATEYWNWFQFSNQTVDFPWKIIKLYRTAKCSKYITACISRL